MLLRDLDKAVRASGLNVREVHGWRERGHGEFKGLSSVTCNSGTGDCTVAEA